MVRRSGGQLRFLPADVLGWPLLGLGLSLLSHTRVISNRVADGPYTVRLLLATPLDWFVDARGWLGLVVVAVAVVCLVLATPRSAWQRWGTAMRYPAFTAAAFVLAVGVLLSMWRAFSHVTDIAPGGVEWRFLAVQRTHWGNDLSTVLLALASLACFVLSFGWPQRQGRKRVPTTTAATASKSNTMPAGVATQSRSSGAAKPPRAGS